MPFRVKSWSSNGSRESKRLFGRCIGYRLDRDRHFNLLPKGGDAREEKNGYEKRKNYWLCHCSISYNWDFFVDGCPINPCRVLSALAVRDPQNPFWISFRSVCKSRWFINQNDSCIILPSHITQIRTRLPLKFFLSFNILLTCGQYRTSCLKVRIHWKGPLGNIKSRGFPSPSNDGFGFL